MDTNSKKRWRLYVLKLENDKWYVGITSKTTEKRFHEHKIGRGANWTRRYKPVKIHFQKNLDTRDIERAQLYEGRVTRVYMEKYGDNNVRGGDLVGTDDYLRRFGSFVTKSDWEVVMALSGLLLAVAYLLFDKYFF